MSDINSALSAAPEKNQSQALEEAITKFFLLNQVKGFLDHEEGMALANCAFQQARLGPCLELGSYCGKSSVYLGLACRAQAQVLFAVDHHRGSEEHQFGELYHDADLFDEHLSKMDSFPSFRHTLAAAALEDTVVPIVTHSALARKAWQTPLAFVFIDGGHSEAMAIDDCVGWSEKLAPGAVLAIHDVFDSPELGGQGPRLGMQAVLDTGRFSLEQRTKSLVFLRKAASNR